MTEPDRENLTYRQSAVGLVIDKQKKVLLVQKINYGDNQWDIPGGGIHTELNEEAEAALLRELKEELGLNTFKIIGRSKILDQYEWPEEVILRKLRENGKTYRGQERIQFLVEFLGDKKEIVFPPDEIRAVKWVSMNDLKEYLVFPNQWQKIQDLIEEFSLRNSKL